WHVSRSQLSVFFFQAEDGIRDRNVTGVQTCALPICDRGATAAAIQRAVVKRHGPFTSPESISFDGIPSEEEWTAALAHQCRPKVSASEAASVVQAAWSSV